VPLRLKYVIKSALENIVRKYYTPTTKGLELESLPNVPENCHTYRQLLTDERVVRKPGGWLYKGNFYPDYLTAGGASHAIFREALKYCQGKGIDVGAGLWPLPGAIPVDISRGPGFGKIVSEFRDYSLDYVFSSHCLEHIENWKEALAKWIRKLKPGGVISLPATSRLRNLAPRLTFRRRWA